jgi:hypothetical protein
LSKVVVRLALFLFADFAQGILDEPDGGSRIKNVVLVEVDIDSMPTIMRFIFKRAGNKMFTPRG